MSSEPEDESAAALTVEDALVARGSRIALAGLLFSVLFVAGWLLLRESPRFDATDEEVLAYFGDPDRRRGSAIAALYLVPFAAVAFIWFLGALRDRYLRAAAREDTILSSAQVVAGTLVVTSLFTLAATELAVVWLAETGDLFDVDAARSLLAIGQSTSDIMALRSTAVFVGVSSTRAVRSGLFPRGYGAVSMLIALALLFVYEALPGISLLFPAWVAGSSIIILLRRRAIGRAEAA
jgi:hypothetical protein